MLTEKGQQGCGGGHEENMISIGEPRRESCSRRGLIDSAEHGVANAVRAVYDVCS